MTLHAYIEYKCKKCKTLFVPFPISPRCPKCGHRSSKVFNNFIEDTIRSALYNLSSYGSFVPPAWVTMTIGDHYYWLAFHFLSFVSSSVKIEEKELLGQNIPEDNARKLTSKFLDSINFGKQGYMATTFENYFVRLLYSPRINGIAEQETKLRVSCFLCHCVADKTFCDKLYSDLLASGIGCWYFPEDATFGKTMWGEIDNQISSCDKVVVVCSENSLRSAPVLREIERALQREDAEGKDILLPIRIDDYVLKDWNHPRKADVVNKVVGDFQKWQTRKEYAKSLQRLMDAIKK